MEPALELAPALVMPELRPEPEPELELELELVMSRSSRVRRFARGVASFARSGAGSPTELVERARTCRTVSAPSSSS
jgi:hypothetical protein